MGGKFAGSKEQKEKRVVEITPWEKGVQIGQNKQCSPLHPPTKMKQTTTTKKNFPFL